MKTPSPRPLNPTLTALGLCLLAALGATSGCGSPHQANIQLRRRNAELEAEVAKLRALTDVTATRASTSPSDPPSLYVPTRLDLGRLTGTTDAGLRIYVCPKDAAGDPAKWPGTFTIRAYEPASGAGGDGRLAGEWSFSGAKLAQAWHSGGLLYEYVLDCPLPGADKLHDVKIVVEFTGPFIPAPLKAQTITSQ